MLVCFAEPKAQFGSFFNAAAAWLTGGRFCHVAVVFEVQNPNGTREYSEVVVVKTGHEKDDVVKMCEVEDFDGWTCYRLTFSDPAIEKNCLNYVNENWVGKSYDKVGSVMDFTLCFCFPRGYRTLSTSESDVKTYCSRLVMRILQYCQEFTDHAPEKVSPNEIYKLIKKDNQKHPNKWIDVSSHVNALLHNKNVQSFWIPKPNPDGTVSYFLF